MFEAVQVEVVVARLGDDDGGHHLTPGDVLHPDHGNVLDPRVGQEHGLNVQGGDLVSSTLDDVCTCPPQYSEVAILYLERRVSISKVVLGYS